MHRRHAAALALMGAILFGASPPARAEGGIASRVAPMVDGRSAWGVDERRGMRMQLYAAGVELPLSRSLHSRLLVMGARFAGRPRAGGEPTPMGLGGEAGLHLAPWPDAWIRPQLFGSIGILGFPESDFLPGGSRYDFILRGGLGVDVSVTSQLDLGVDVFGLHISNGQGIGEHNPAFDGYGGGLHLSYALAPREPIEAPFGDDEPGVATPGYIPGIITEGSVGTVDGALLGVARALFAQRLVGGLLAVVDGEAGALADEPFGEIGLAFAAHVDPISFGAHGGYRRYVGLDTTVVSAQIEGHVSGEVSLIAVVHYEDSELVGDFGRTAGGVRAYPHASLMIEGGLGVAPIGADRDSFLDAPHVAPFAGVEWALPLPLEPFQIALFAESRLSEARVVGLRFAGGVGETPRDVSRQRAWRRVR